MFALEICKNQIVKNNIRKYSLVIDINATQLDCFLCVQDTQVSQLNHTQAAQAQS